MLNRKQRKKPEFPPLLGRLAKVTPQWKCKLCGERVGNIVPKPVLAEATRHWKKEHPAAWHALKRGNWLSILLNTKTPWI
jgi:hypothetical protein